MRLKTSLFITCFFSAFILTSCLPPDSESQNSEDINVEILAQNLEVPWGLDFLPNGDLIFTERPGKISILSKENNQLQLIHERSVIDRSEGGLLGLAVDPDFQKTGFVFIYETAKESNQVVRLKLKNEQVVDEAVIVGGIPKSRFHNGGILRFGPDGYLYIGTGDARDPELSQDINSLAGKILRVDENGNAVSGNPFGNKVWTIGHRNVQGIDWSIDGKMVATEHGPTGEVNGWCCHDEINIIEKGKNYGWPLYKGSESETGMELPLSHSGKDTWAPGGGLFIKGEIWKEWEGSYILAGLRGRRLLRFTFDSDMKSVLSQEEVFKGKYKRLRNIIQAPDGSLIFCSSNHDGRNPMPVKGDDKIYRLTSLK
jgi:glucose/arabinose dehydrogenase